MFFFIKYDIALAFNFLIIIKIKYNILMILCQGCETCEYLYKKETYLIVKNVFISTK